MGEKRKLKEKDKSHTNEEPSWRMKLLLTPEQDKQSNEENDVVKSAAKPKKERDFLDRLLAVKKNTPKEKINLNEKGKKVINDETSEDEDDEEIDKTKSPAPPDQEPSLADQLTSAIEGASGNVGGSPSSKQMQEEYAKLKKLIEEDDKKEKDIGKEKEAVVIDDEVV